MNQIPKKKHQLLQEKQEIEILINIKICSQGSPQAQRLHWEILANI